MQKCKRLITEEELLKAFKKMPNNMLLENDVMTKEFYEVFWYDLKIPLLLSIDKAFKVAELSTSQKQAVIKLIEKKDQDKRLNKKWKPISLLSIGKKLLAKLLAEHLKTYVPSLISSNQTTYLNGKLISEGGCPISEMFEISKLLKLKALLMLLLKIIIFYQKY